MMVSLTSFGGNLSKQKLTLLLAECQTYDGAEVIQLGRFSTHALRGLLSIAAFGDPKAKELLRIMKGAKGLSVLDYAACCDEDRAEINRRLDELFEHTEVLMEVHDGADHLLAIGVLNEVDATLSDCVVYAPADCALICVFDDQSKEKAVHIIDNDNTEDKEQ